MTIEEIRQEEKQLIAHFRRVARDLDAYAQSCTEYGAPTSGMIAHFVSELFAVEKEARTYLVHLDKELDEEYNSMRKEGLHDD